MRTFFCSQIIHRIFIDKLGKMSIIIVEGQRKSKSRGELKMGLSDRIEAFITELLKEDSDEWLELRRNELASVFGCVPSQINYVIATRFSPEHGYIVESRRGGGGYLRIKQLQGADSLIIDTIKAIGKSIDEKTAKAYISNLVRQNALTEHDASLILSGISDNVLTADEPLRSVLRANILKNMLLQKGTM